MLSIFTSFTGVVLSYRKLDPNEFHFFETMNVINICILVLPSKVFALSSWTIFLFLPNLIQLLQ